MKTRPLGNTGKQVGAIGFGAMSFAGFFGPTDEATSLRCLDAAYEAGIDFWDTSNVYGDGLSEQVIGTWLASRKLAPVIASKVGIVRDPKAPVDNSASHIREQIEGTLGRLGVDHLDLYYLHRHDQSVPIEDVAGTFGQLIDEGKIGSYGLSEIAPSTLRRAHAERPVTAVQNEYSLWTRMPELGLLQACAELGVTFVPFSPLARGVLGQTAPSLESMADKDFRRSIPRFRPDNYPRNLALIEPFRDFARDRGVTVSALALAWLLDRDDTLIPIPGTRTAEHLQEWAQADQITLTDADRKEIERILPVGFAHGDRYSSKVAMSVERYC